MKRAESMIMAPDKPMDKMGPRDFMKLGDFAKNVPAAQKAYKGVSVKDLSAALRFADRYKNAGYFYTTQGS